MRIAVISDIHGNALALEAVLDDIARHGPDAILNLGDHFSGPLDPARTARLLSQIDAITVTGNHDRYIVDAEPEENAIIAALPAETLHWLRTLPATAKFEDQIFLSHGAPASDEIYWLDRPAGNVFRTSSIAEIEAELPGEKFPLYCCGHTHVARVVSLPDGGTVFNPGSVGRPSFNMSDPASASRASPDAAYALLTRSGGSWTIDLKQVPYDHEAAAALALANGSRGWAKDLRHGRRR